MNNEFGELTHMVTNEKNREKADRRIPFNVFDIFYEILGNMHGDEIRIWFQDNELITYVSDNGFLPEDKKAICEKNSSGNNNMTVGHNGFGIRLVLDRILPEGDVFSTIYSLNDRKKGAIGHFSSTKPDEWLNFNENDQQYISKFNIKNHKKGTFFKIPLEYAYVLDFKENEDDIKLACNKYLSNKIADKEVKFYWNDHEQIVEKICKDEGCLVIDYSLGYDSINDQLSSTHKLPLILKINKINGNSDYDKECYNEYTQIRSIKKNTNNPCSFFTKFEDGQLRLNRCNDTANCPFTKKNVAIVDGSQVVINGYLVTYKAIAKNLGGKTQAGNFTKIDNKYGGKPRFQNFVSKTTRQFSIPVDKTNIKPTNIGEHVLKFQSQIAQEFFSRKDNDKNKKKKTNITCLVTGDKMNISTKNYETRNSSQTILYSNTFIQKNNIDHCIVEEKKEKRNNFNNKTQKQEVGKYAKYESTLYKDCPYYDKDIERCPMCDCICSPSHKVAGHIQSDKNEGTTDIMNCLMICQRCNNCDTMLIPERVILRFGINHPITIRLEKYMIKTNKNHKDYFENYRQSMIPSDASTQSTP